MKVMAAFHSGVVATEANESLQEVASRMQFDEVGSVIIYEQGRFAGIITERDLVRAMADGADPDETPVRTYMTDEPVVVDPETDVDRAAAEMVELGIRHLPVVVGGEVVGMVSARDLLLPRNHPSDGVGALALVGARG